MGAQCRAYRVKERILKEIKKGVGGEGGEHFGNMPRRMDRFNNSRAGWCVRQKQPFELGDGDFGCAGLFVGCQRSSQDEQNTPPSLIPWTDRAAIQVYSTTGGLVSLHIFLYLFFLGWGVCLVRARAVKPSAYR